MALLVFGALLFLSISLTKLLVIQPLDLSVFFHLPQIFFWGMLLIVFSWLFGDEAKPY